MTDLADFARVGAEDHGLCVVTTLRADSTIQASMVNAGVMEHPVTGRLVAAFVAVGGSRKLANLRHASARHVGCAFGLAMGRGRGSGPAVRSRRSARVAGSDRSPAGVPPAVFVAAGGDHGDWDEYDRVMAAERRTIVFVEADRVYSNG